MFTLQRCDLRLLNSITKYPSIPTYHAMGQRGVFADEHIELPEKLIVTEKVDGTNARVILTPDGRYLIGSREHLLHADGDLVSNPALGIVDALKPIAQRLLLDAPPIGLTVYYFEVFGGRITAASKQYSGTRRVAHRLFDILRTDADAFDELMSRPLEAIAAWREAGKQPFEPEADLQIASSVLKLPLTPRVAIDDVPVSHADVYSWLCGVMPETWCRLDDQSMGRPEGVVVRTPDRTRIAKIRYVDYERTIKRQRTSRR